MQEKYLLEVSIIMYENHGGCVMKKSVSNMIFGFVFLALGIIFGFRAFGYDLNIFFDGWWTLFIIIPSISGLFQKHNRISSIIGLGVGILLLLAAQDIIDGSMFISLMIALIFVAIGFHILFRKDASYYHSSARYNSASPDIKKYSAFFSGKDIRFDNQVFLGATMSVAFGGIDLDLSRSIIQKDTYIDASCIFGGIDIRVPHNVRVDINCTPILGGIENRASTPMSGDGGQIPTLYINGTCILGGIDVK